MNKNKRTLRRIGVGLLALMMVISCLIPVTTVYGYTEQEGTVNDEPVNVRKGAGTSYAILTHNGSNVQLNKGHTVTIVDEAKASDGATWYKIRFNYSGASLTGYMHSAYITIKAQTPDYDEDADFEAYLKEQRFPEAYKKKLRLLHQQYPKWVFVADYVGYSFDEVLEAESAVGMSLIDKSAISSWKSTDEKAYNWETSTYYIFDSAWHAASKELVAYSLDPRNFLDEENIFMFESLSYDSKIHTLTGLRGILKGTFMSGAKIKDNDGKSKYYSTVLMEAAKKYNVSPYTLAVRIIQEQGVNGTGSCISGTVSGYEGLYNHFDVGAYAANGNNAVINGLIYAQGGVNKNQTSFGRPWNTPYKAIFGGTEYLASGYISQGQDTLYYERFDLVGQPYTHQYMTHILNPTLEAKRMSKAYSETVKKNTAFVFRIPVYTGMPKTISALPTGDGSPNNALSSIKVSGYNITPTFSKFTTKYNLIVRNEVESVKISAKAYDSTAKISGAGTVSLKVGTNTKKIKVTAQNGDVRTYTLVIVRKEADALPVTVTTNYTMKDRYLSGVTIGTTVRKFKSNIKLENATCKVLNASGEEAGNTARIATGYRYIIYDSTGKQYGNYQVLLYGDVTKDGKVDTRDMLHVRQYVLGKRKLSSLAFKVADVTHNGKVDSADVEGIRKQILGKKIIKQ